MADKWKTELDAMRKRQDIDDFYKAKSITSNLVAGYSSPQAATFTITGDPK